ncbi:MAG: hypothetical protein KME04_12355 [Pleurocapsa minor GSE-CHR-MK-17-07R]|jgi:hypothetical protein|nr:hypothetical protein [Pleurocapsa minor GSE-CHR-MK 17-07R]
MREVATATPQTGLAHLQRFVGNAGIQRMLGKPSVPAITQRGQAGQVHRKGCGCAACGGGKQEEEQVPGQTSEVVVQRWWDDEEESAESDSDSGGSWLDSVSDTVSDVYNSVTESNETESGGGGGGNTAYGSTSESESSESDSDEGGGWWDDVKQGASDAYNSVMGEDESSESESEVDPDQIADDVQVEDGGWRDWLPNSWFEDENKTAEEIAEEHEEEKEEENGGSTSGVGSCISTGHGDGGNFNVSVAGLTTANFAAATGNGSFKLKSKKKKMVGGQETWDVKGDISVTYTLPEPTVAYTYTPEKSKLTQCELEAVERYVSDTLSVHENEHVLAFKMFNGTETVERSYPGMTGTESEINQQIQNEVNATVAGMIVARQEMAQEASDKLDPFNGVIEGLDICSYYDNNPDE